MLAGAVAALAATLTAAAGPTSASVAAPQGRLHVPADCQKTYEHLGSRAFAADKATGSREMHIVYASPGAGMGR